MDIYSTFVRHIRESARALWDAEAAEVQHACENLNQRLAAATGDIGGQVAATEDQIEVLTEERNRLRHSVQEEIEDLLKQCRLLERHYLMRHTGETLSASEWVLPRESRHQKSLMELRRHLADQQREIAFFRVKMADVLETECRLVDSQQELFQDASRLQDEVALLESNIQALRDQIGREYDIGPDVLDSLSELESDVASRLQAWMLEKRTDAEIEREWGIPDNVMVTLVDQNRSTH